METNAFTVQIYSCEQRAKRICLHVHLTFVERRRILGKVVLKSYIIWFDIRYKKNGVYNIL